MLVLAAILFGLGVWQMERLGQKEALIARIAERMSDTPSALPPASEWVGLDPEVWDYRPVRLSGHFVTGNSVLVFTSLSDPKGKYGGPGYWVMTPFAVDGGGYVLVNRGFVPDASKANYADNTPVPAGDIVLTGIARKSEATGPFTPGPDTAHNIEWVRNVGRLKQMIDPKLTPLADIYIDQSAGPAGALPQGGETEVAVPNRHFEYALTWFGLGGVTIVWLGAWLLKRRRA